MIEQIESRRFLSASAVLSNAELRVAVVSSMNTRIEVSHSEGRISVHVQDEGAMRRVYVGTRRAISSIRIIGSAASDRITLGEGLRATTIEAGGGKDIVFGNAAENVIYGGEGNDSLVGGGGNDIIYGEAGRDTIYGGEGDDRIMGGKDIDHLFGEAGDDRLEGGASKHTDYLDGGIGADRLIGGDGTDRFQLDGDDRFTDADLNEDPTLIPSPRKG
jgi:Ca2+-binding RTX toxin-like protein